MASMYLIAILLIKAQSELFQHGYSAKHQDQVNLKSC